MLVDYNVLQNNLNNIKIKKTPNTFLQILDKKYNEVLVSKYLAYLIDERNTNRNILRQILIKTRNDSEPDFVELLEYATLESIKTEDSISSRSRLDIIIKYSSFWAVIENKIWAFESRINQTCDYEKHLNGLNLHKVPIKYIYLKPNFNISQPSNKHFTELFYGDLVNILKRIKKSDLCVKENYSYLKDFIKHSEEFFMKDNQFNCDDPALKFYLKNKSKIDCIIEMYKKQASNLSELLVKSIKEAFPTFRVQNTAKYIQIFKENWENYNWKGIHFEILSSGPNFENLLGSEAVELSFALHNEKATKEKYRNVINKTLYTKKYNFDNNENIQKSIQGIINEIKLLINEYEKIIDAEISQNYSIR